MGMDMNMCCVPCLEKSLICFPSRNDHHREGEYSTNNLSLRDDSATQQTKLKTNHRTNNQSKYSFDLTTNNNISSISPSTSPDIFNVLNEKDNVTTSIKSLNLKQLIQSKIGLTNMGNSCFINSIIQILIHCLPFLREFDKENVTKDNIISFAFRELLIHLSTLTNTNTTTSTSNKIKYCPRSFIKTFSEVNKSFIRQSQQDSQDFLITLLENINAELNLIQCKIPYRELNQTGSKLILYNEFISYFNKREKSIITNVFYWNDLSIRKCKCGHQTHVFSKKTDLPLNLLKSNLNPHVTQLIKDKYSKQVTDDEVSPIECINCNRKEVCQLDNVICSLPQVLILSLQRNNGEDSQKNKIGVEFDDEIDLGDIVDRDILGKGVQLETRFKLYGLVLHLGVIERGHYITSVKMGKSWVMFDDEVIETTPIADGNSGKYKSSDVYCLFYLRKDCLSA